MFGERGCCSGVIGGCNMLSWFLWLFSRKSSLGAESWTSSNMSQCVCGKLCGQGSAEIVSVSRSCCGWVVLSLSLCDLSTAWTSQRHWHYSSRPQGGSGGSVQLMENTEHERKASQLLTNTE